MKLVKLFSAHGITFFAALTRESARHNPHYAVGMQCEGMASPVVVNTSDSTGTLYGAYRDALRDGLLVGTPKRLEALERVMGLIMRRNRGYDVNTLANVEFLCKGFKNGGDYLRVARNYWSHNIMELGYHRVSRDYSEDY